MIKIKRGKVKLEAWMGVLVIIIIAVGLYTLYTPETPFVEDIDNNPPTVQILEPTARETVSGEVKIKIKAMDIGTGIDKVEVQIISGSVQYTRDAQSTLESNVYVYEWDTLGSPNGDCEVRVTAYDRAGNECGTSIIVNVQNQMIL